MLSGPQILQWTDALFNAFSDEEFADLLLRLNDTIRKYSNPNRVSRQIVEDVVDAYQRRYEEANLIQAAIEARPANPVLLRLASEKQAAAAPDDANLQNLIKKTNSLLDLSLWLEKAGKLQVCVCRIEIPTQAGDMIYGTGFLVGPDRLMTNWHVFRSVIAQEENDSSYIVARARAADVTCRFDYKVLENNAKSLGSTYSLAQDWRVALSPNSPRNREPNIDELDCAVVKLAQPVGTLPVGDAQSKRIKGDPRGFITLPSVNQEGHKFNPRTPLFMIQHPDAEPIKLALDTEAIDSINPNRTRVDYSTNSKPGSSGSPCFDQNWNLIALHHSGDPNFVEGGTPGPNQGIPIDTIVSFLAKHNALN
jgi:hypothetical protein